MRVFVFFTAFFITFSAFAGNSNLNTEDKAWLKLLHYASRGSGYFSLVENQEFFITSNGREDPVAEFNAAIMAFNTAGDELKCRFPARFMWLRKAGKVSGTLGDCEDYQKFLSDVQPKAVTMLFTDAYMSNPSSLFGHTLFRIDTKRKGTQLLAHGANFGADTGDEDGVLYALKGLWGGYYGTFGVKPYYDVINQYNNIENRDIWEYELNLSDDELALFTAHLWEMKQAKIRYYFTHKNCSYVLLSMLEAIRPELELTKDFGGYVLPLATLKTVQAQEGLVGNVNYRPSRQSKLKHRLKQMKQAQKKALRVVLDNGVFDDMEINEEEKADVLETAYQYVQYQYVEKAYELNEYRQKSFALLKARSKIVNQHQYFDEPKEGKNPVYAHEALALQVGVGGRKGESFQEISFQPVYTSLLDDSYGMLKGAEINLFSTKLRHYDSADKVVLDEFNFLNITSLTGVDMLFSPFSYEIGAGVKRVFDAKDGEEHTAFDLKIGGGQSFQLDENAVMYLLTIPNAVWGGGMQDNGYAGLAFKGGVYYNLDNVRFNVSAMQNFTTNKIAYGQTYQAEAVYGLSRNMAVYAAYKLFNSDFNDDEELSAGVRFNF